jgi:anti-sigma factor RsiW
MEHGIHDLTAAYALDALGEEERAAYEAHLAGCDACSGELASYATVTAALAVGASGPAPTPELRERILDAARDEPQNVVALAPRHSRLVPVLAAATAAAAAIAIALGAYAMSLDSDLAESRAALTQQARAALVLADPNARTIALAAGDGRLVVGDDGSAVLAVSNLAPVPEGKTYQAWVVSPDGPVSGGTFVASDGGALLALVAPVTSDDVVAVTIEDAGGVEAPTTEPVVASQPV